MNQLILNIENENILDKLLWMLKHFEDDGVKIVEEKKQHEKTFSDEYLKENWKEMVMTSGDNSNYYKSDEYYEDRADDYQKRGKV